MFPTQGFGTGSAISTHGYGGSVAFVTGIAEWYDIIVKFDIDGRAT